MIDVLLAVGVFVCWTVLGGGLVALFITTWARNERRINGR